MNARKFVSSSSVILLGWLGATFLNDVPAQRYPRLDKKVGAAVVTPTGKVVVLGVNVLPK